MKILFANKFFYLNGGSETVFFQERNFLKENGVEVIDFSMQDDRNFPSDYSEFFVPKVSFKNQAGFASKLQTAASFVHSKEAVKRLASLLDREKPQIAHLHNIYHQLTPSIIPLLKEKDVKVILTLHDGKLVCPAYLMLNNNGNVCVACKGRRFYKAITTRCQDSFLNTLLLAAESYWHKWKRSYDMVDLFIAPSRFLADLVSQYRVPEEKILVLRNGIDESYYIPEDVDGGYVLYFGRLSREKGIETLLAAHSITESNMPLKVVGTGPIEHDLKRRYPDVEFMGYKTGQELLTIVKKASFVVVPSECYENCSMVVLESMALARPVIGSKIGGIPEQIEDGVTGYLFEMGDTGSLAEKMQSLWLNQEIRHNMGIAARQKMERDYSLKSHLENLMIIYKQILSSN